MSVTHSGLKHWCRHTDLKTEIRQLKQQLSASQQNMIARNAGHFVRDIMSNTNEVKMRKKSFTHEFKQECINLVLQHKYPVTQAAETMNIGLSTLQRWLRQYRGEIRGNTPIASAITPEQRRIQELEKQVRQLQSDNDLLKKASAFFAMEMNNDKKSR